MKLKTAHYLSANTYQSAKRWHWPTIILCPGIRHQHYPAELLSLTTKTTLLIFERFFSALDIFVVVSDVVRAAHIVGAAV